MLREIALVFNGIAFLVLFILYAEHGLPQGANFLFFLLLTVLVPGVNIVALLSRKKCDCVAENLNPILMGKERSQNWLKWLGRPRTLMN